MLFRGYRGCHSTVHGLIVELVDTNIIIRVDPSTRRLHSWLPVQGIPPPPFRWGHAQSSRHEGENDAAAGSRGNDKTPDHTPFTEPG